MSRSVQQDYDKARGVEVRYSVTVTGHRAVIECLTCKQSMAVDRSSQWGAGMIKNWPKYHKCPKELR